MPPDTGLSVWEFTCTRCGHSGLDKHNMARHAARACHDAELSRQKLYLVTWTNDPELAKSLCLQAGTGFVTASPADHPTRRNDITRDTLLGTPAITALFSEEEKATLLKMARGKLFDMISCGSSCGNSCGSSGPKMPVRGACARLFRACKLGTCVPVAVQNMGVRGNDIVYKDEDDVSACSKARMGSTLLVWLLRILREALLEAIDDEDDVRRSSALEHVWAAWFDSGKPTLEHAAQAYEADRDRFDAMPKPVRDMIRSEARGIVHLAGKLPKFSGCL